MKFRYLIAQVLIFTLWAFDWYRRGASHSERPLFEALLGSFLIILFFTGIPAILVGAIDSAVGRRIESWAKNITLIFISLRVSNLDFKGGH